MRKFILIFLSMFLVSSGALYAASENGKKSGKLTISGIIVDNHCAILNKSGMEDIIKSYSKECALMPECASSGYSLYHYGTLLKFSRDSSRKIEQFLKNKRSKLDVIVVVTKAGEEYNLVSIKNK